MLLSSCNATQLAGGIVVMADTTRGLPRHDSIDMVRTIERLAKS
jgi:hypothetical protein